MPLDAEERSQRAKMAGTASGVSRQYGKDARDANIVRAFDYLQGKWQAPKDAERAYRFLKKQGHGVNLPDGVSPLRFLAVATGLTRQRVWQIVKTAKDCI